MGGQLTAEQQNSEQRGAAGAAATAGEVFMREDFGESAADICRLHLDRWSVDDLQALAKRAATADRPVAFMISAVKNGYEVPRRGLAYGHDRQTDEQRAANIRERVRNQYAMAMSEGTPDQRAAIEQRHGDLAALVAADPLDFASDRASHIPIDTLHRLVSLNGDGALVAGELAP